MSEVTARQLTEGLTKAVTGYFTKKIFAVHNEFGLGRGGKLRADVIALHTDTTIVIVEVKRGFADFKTDHKWPEYLRYCDKLYILVPTKADNDRLVDYLRENRYNNVGTMFLNNQGLCEVGKMAKFKWMDEELRWQLILKMAWRTGSNASNMQRRRVFIEGVNIHNKDM